MPLIRLLKQARRQRVEYSLTDIRIFHKPEIIAVEKIPKTGDIIETKAGERLPVLYPLLYALRECRDYREEELPVVFCDDPLAASEEVAAVKEINRSLEPSQHVASQYKRVERGRPGASYDSVCTPRSPSHMDGIYFEDEERRRFNLDVDLHRTLPLGGMCVHAPRFIVVFEDNEYDGHPTLLPNERRH